MRSDIKELEGKTLTEIRGEIGDDEILFITAENERYRMYHHQDCCESVYVQDICGDWSDLIGNPILLAEEVNSDSAPPLEPYEESFTWTFYKLATIKGSVTIRWYGASNGFYSESVDFEKID